MAYTPRLPGRVKDGQLVMADPVAWRTLLARHNGREVVVTVTRVQHLRSLPQNRYYHGVVVDMIAGYIGESRDETHELLKSRFLPVRRVELLDGQFIEMPPTTRLLTVEEMTAYIEQVRVWAAQFLGLSIPDAGEVEMA
jgi:hypothetical protein